MFGFNRRRIAVLLVAAVLSWPAVAAANPDDWRGEWPRTDAAVSGAICYSNWLPAQWHS